VENVEQFEVAHDGRHMKEAYHESRKNTHNRGEGSLFFWNCDFRRQTSAVVIMAFYGRKEYWDERYTM
jgi:hypothetical protein